MREIQWPRILLHVLFNQYILSRHLCSVSFQHSLFYVLFFQVIFRRWRVCCALAPGTLSLDLLMCLPWSVAGAKNSRVVDVYMTVGQYDKYGSMTAVNLRRGASMKGSLLPTGPIKLVRVVLARAGPPKESYTRYTCTQGSLLPHWGRKCMRSDY